LSGDDVDPREPHSSFITMNWRGKPLTCLRTVIALFSATATTTGLTIQADYDPNWWYPTGVKISDTQLAAGPPCSPATSTATGTTPSTLNQMRREP